MITIQHSGNIGDLLYSLPAMRKASELSGQDVHLFMRINVPMQAKVNHPNNGVQMTERIAEMAKPLLMTTGFIKKMTITDQPTKVDYDFDMFRKIHNYTGHISQWYFHTYPELTCDLSDPMAFRIKERTPARPIIINRTARYHNPSFDYTVLRPYQHLITFVGLPEEYRIISAKLPNITHTEVKDFKELAELIKGSELFIGNQSMAFALAELMKVNRYLEICPYAHNVIPTGQNGYGCWNVMNLIRLMNINYGRDKQGASAQSK